MQFALKSLILDRCSKTQLQQELRNEGTLERARFARDTAHLVVVEILKDLDHPQH